MPPDESQSDESLTAPPGSDQLGMGCLFGGCFLGMGFGLVVLIFIGMMYNGSDRFLFYLFSGVAPYAVLCSLVTPEQFSSAAPIALAFAQFAIYGILLGIAANQNQRVRLIVFAYVSILHLTAVGVCLLLTYRD